MAYHKVEKYINSDIHSSGFWKNDETNLNAANMNSLTEGVNAVAEAISGDGGLDSRVKENENFIAANESNIRDINNIRDRLNNESKYTTELGNRTSAHEEQYGKNSLNLGGSAVVIQNNNGTAEIAGSNKDTSVRAVGDLVISSSDSNGVVSDNIRLEKEGNITARKFVINKDENTSLDIEKLITDEITNRVNESIKIKEDLSNEITNRSNESTEIKEDLSKLTDKVGLSQSIYKVPESTTPNDTACYIEPNAGTMEVHGDSNTAARVVGGLKVSKKVDDVTADVVSIDTEGKITAEDIELKNRLSTKDLDATGSVSVGGSLSTDSNISVKGTAKVDGKSTLSSLEVTGATTIKGVTSIQSNTSVSGSLNVSNQVSTASGYKVNDNFVPIVTIQENENDASFHTKKPIIHIGNEAPIPESNEIYLWVDTTSIIQ